MSALDTMPSPIPASFYWSRIEGKIRSKPAAQQPVYRALVEEERPLLAEVIEEARQEDHEAIVEAIKGVLRDNGIPV